MTKRLTGPARNGLVRPGHTLSNGLLFYVPMIPGGVFDRVSGQPGQLQTAGGFGRYIPKIGQVFENDASDGGYYRFKPSPLWLQYAGVGSGAGIKNVTVTVALIWDVNTAYQYPFAIEKGADDDVMAVRLNLSSSTADFRIEQLGNTKNGRSATSYVPTGEALFLTMVKRDTDCYFYKNGQHFSTHTGRFTDGVGVTITADSYLNIGRGPDGVGSSYAVDGAIGLVSIHNRPLAPDEIWQYYLDPWAPVSVDRIIVANTVSGGSPVTVSPTASSAVMSSTGAAVLGSVTEAPSPVATIAATVAGTAIKGSYSVTPATGHSVASVASPGVVLGSVVIAPAACSAVMSMTGSYTTGIGTVEPTPIAAVVSTPAGTAIKGSWSDAPTANTTITATAGPTVIKGSVAVTPSSVETVMSTTGTVAAGDIFVTPTAGYVVTTSTGTAIMGAYAPTVDPSGALTATAGPTVIKGDFSGTPSAVGTIAAALVGDVLLSGAVRPDPASVIMASAIGAVVGSGAIEITITHESAVALTHEHDAVVICLVESVNV